MTAFQMEIVWLAGDNMVDRDVLTQYAPLIEPLVRTLIADEGEVEE
jgi:hypothetical protein